MTPTEINDLLDATANVLLWCVIVGFVLLALSLGILLVAGDLAHEIHSKWFDVSPHEFDLICYCGLGLGKTLVILLFLVPWVAIRLVLRKRRQGPMRT